MDPVRRLSETVNVRGPGIPDLTATLIKREGKLCMYERSDGVIEVFKVQQEKEGEIEGRYYPSREVYPGNDDFGKTAWCFRNYDQAEERYNNMLKNLKGCTPGQRPKTGLKSKSNTKVPLEGS